MKRDIFIGLLLVVAFSVAAPVVGAAETVHPAEAATSPFGLLAYHDEDGSAQHIADALVSSRDDGLLADGLQEAAEGDFAAADESAPSVGTDSAEAAPAPNPNPPDRKVRLIFIHHSTGEAWLADDHGRLGIALRNSGYFVSDTNYGWGPDAIGDRTDIGHWWLWFRGSAYKTYTKALYAESGQNCSYSRLASNPGGPNEIVMFKSCFPNSALKGKANAAIPPIGSNHLKGESSDSAYHTVANAKGIYVDILKYFKTKRDKLFIVVAAPPLSDETYSSNARAFNQWLVNTWLKGYPYKNVFVFDFYNVLTTNGGNPNKNDLNSATGNHHRWWKGAIQHKTNGDNDSNPNVLEYPSDGDDHPTRAGDLKATGEYIKLLNIAYNRWRPRLGDAVDNNGLVWTTGGAAKWFGQTATAVYDGDAAQSGRTSNSAQTWLGTTVTGPGTIEFYWKVSCQAGDILMFSVDGKEQSRIQGATAWAQKTYSIGSGTHKLKWTYKKNASGSSGLDAGLVDRVRWTAGS